MSVLQREPSLVELIDLPSFTEVCQSFVELYRVGVKVFAADGTRIVDIKTEGGEFCGHMFTRTPGKRLCTATVNHVRTCALSASDGAQSYDCFSGLRYLVRPILHEGGVVGRAVFGPFRPDALDAPAPALDAMCEEGVYDRERTTALLRRVRQAPDLTMRRVIDQFAHIVEVLVFTSYRATLATQMHIESITESYRALKEKSKSLREAYDRLKEIDRLKSNFLATVSHELRTPLTSVIGYSEMLLAGLAGELTPEQDDYLRTILEKSESLLNLITSLLDLSKIEARGVSLRMSQTALSGLVDTAISTVLPQAQRKNIRLLADVAPSLPNVLVDPDKVRQCLVNLVSNAVKFTPEGKQIIVHARLAENAPEQAGPFGPGAHFELSVEDEGIGIAEEHLDRVFDTFYQEDSSSTREYPGAGLGLSIVKSYVEAHEGEIQVKSAQGSGSTFTMTFPIRTGTPSASPGREA